MANTTHCFDVYSRLFNITDLHTCREDSEHLSVYTIPSRTAMHNHIHAGRAHRHTQKRFP